MSILPIGKREAYRPASSVLLILLMLMLAFLVSCQREPPSPIGQLTEQEKLVDFAYFVEHIKKYYPLLVRQSEIIRQQPGIRASHVLCRRMLE
jgi:hypothetical protein